MTDKTQSDYRKTIGELRRLESDFVISGCRAKSEIINGAISLILSLESMLDDAAFKAEQEPEMTDTTQVLIDALTNLFAAGGVIAKATNEELQKTARNKNIDALIRLQAAAVLGSRRELTAVKAKKESPEFDDMTKRGTEAWKDVPANFVDDLRGGKDE